MNLKSQIILLGLTLSVALHFTATAADNPITFKVGESGGRLSSLVTQGSELVSGEGGGFKIYNVTAKQDVGLKDESLKQEGDQTVYVAKGAGLTLRANFVAKGPYLLVSGEIESQKDENEGFLIDYQIPFVADAAKFGSDLRAEVPVNASAPQESNAFPVGALTNGKSGVAVAIPPSDPRDFGIVADTKGLALRLYLGVTPATKLFPRRATFAFIIYGVTGAEGFRAALSQYYQFFPDYYTPRLKKDGLYMFQMGGRTPANIDDYGFDLFETQLPTFYDALARDQKYGIATFPYMIVGQREMKYLKTLPETYEDALALLEKWTPQDHADIALCKENACSEGDKYLRDEVKNSAVEAPDGRFSVVVRKTIWGANSVTFKLNPNPYLFEGEGRHTVGADALALSDRWLKDHPEFGGLFIDSLGANWPAVLNYRADHFPYARYPLTVDSKGRVALDNAISHYEYINALRDKVRASGRLLNANGVYAYVSKKSAVKGLEKQQLDTKKNEFIDQAAPPEFYRAGVKISRFFLASLLDVASCEFGSKATVEQCQDCRTLLGQKQFAFLNYQWEDEAKVQEFVNKSLCFGIFASTTTNFFSGEQYETSPRGYLRDKELLAWYVPLVRKLSQAGWDPARNATITGEGVVGERFGHGQKIYYTLYNDGTKAAPVTLQLDAAALKLPEKVSIREIAHEQTLAITPDKVISFTAEPKRTYVIEVESN